MNEIDSLPDPFLDRESEIKLNRGAIRPHWFQKGKYHFITFRLADSLDRKSREELNNIIESFKKLNPEPWVETTYNRYRRILSKGKEQLLDKGYGSCVLRQSNIRKIISDTLHFYNNRDFILDTYVIMPNHCHILLLMNSDRELSEVMRDIKGYSSKQIGKLLDKRGELWIRESYDHIVRDEDDLKRIRSYIKENPCFLPENDYEYYDRFLKK